jgi:ABC-2 type transport system permease protein
MNVNRFAIIVWKEFLHVFRDPISLRLALMMPLLFTLIFGYAVTTDVEHIRLAVFDGDKTYESRELVRKFQASNYFDLSYEVTNSSELEALLDSGAVKTALMIPSGYSRKLKRGETPESLLIIDGTDPTIARTALQSGNLVSNIYSMETLSGGAFRLAEMKTRVWYNPNMKSAMFIIPGLIGLIMQNITIMLTAFALVREKETGTIEQLMVSPLRPGELILGKMVPYIVIGSVDFLIALFFGTWYFKVPVVGSLPLLLVLGFLFVITALAIGMLISTVAQNQLQAMQFSFVTILPTVLLSGFMFPREGMPLPIYLVGNAIPLTYFLNIMRGIILKGVGLEFLWKDVLGVALIGTLLLTAAIKRFHKKLD